MNQFFSFNKVLAGSILLAAAGMLLLSSCNKTFDNTLKDDYGDDAASINKGTRKILLVVVDGALGAETRAAAPPNLNLLADFAIHSWDGLTDAKKTAVTNASAWSNLLTGVGSDKHNVTGVDFTDNHLVDYPSLFSRLKQQKPDWRTAAFCSSPDIVQYLADDATEKISFADNDAGVKDAVINELATNDPALVLAQFHAVDKAGEAGTYSVTDAAYKAAILKTDEYIGEILTALRARSSFENENWMVVVTSNKGSNIANDPVAAERNAFDDSRRNTFFFCYNPRFNSQALTKPLVFPYVGSAPLLTNESSKNIRGRVRTGGTTYDIGSTGSFTIECKVKIPAGNYYYPAFLSKRESFSNGVVGWVFFMEGDYWQINFGQSSFGNRQIRGHSIADGKWHTITVVIKQEGAERNVYTYTDGVLYPFTGNKNIADRGNLNSQQDLTMGFLTTASNTDALRNYFITDIKFYNTDLSDSFIASNYCKTTVAPDNPYLVNLLGYWPGTNPVNDELADLSGNGNNFVLEGSYGIGSYNDVSNNLCPEPSYAIVPNAADLAIQVYQWFGILVPSAWNLDGKIWIPAYADVNGG